MTKDEAKQERKRLLIRHMRKSAGEASEAFLAFTDATKRSKRAEALLTEVKSTTFTKQGSETLCLLTLKSGASFYGISYRSPADKIDRPEVGETIALSRAIERAISDYWITTNGK
jgi:hypothetical protein